MKTGIVRIEERGSNIPSDQWLSQVFTWPLVPLQLYLLISEAKSRELALVEHLIKLQW
jgi:hypothetical protein